MAYWKKAKSEHHHGERNTNEKKKTRIYTQIANIYQVSYVNQ